MHWDQWSVGGAAKNEVTANLDPCFWLGQVQSIAVNLELHVGGAIDQLVAGWVAA